MTDYYSTLGVPRTAAADEIKRAYRKLASQHHPDKGGNTEQFQKIQEAYATLSDDAKRAKYDNPRPQFGGFQQGGGPFDFNTIFDMFGTRFQQQHQQPNQARHARMSLWITLADVATAGKKTVSVATHHGTSTIEIEIPPNIQDGDTVQYGRIAPGGLDLLVTFRVQPDPRWRREGANLYTDHRVSIWDLITGAEISIFDVLGNELLMGIPPRTQPGTQLRLKGRGFAQKHAPQGDIFVRMTAYIPDEISESIIEEIVRQKQP